MPPSCVRVAALTILPTVTFPATVEAAPLRVRLSAVMLPAVWESAALLIVMSPVPALTAPENVTVSVVAASPSFAASVMAPFAALVSRPAPSTVRPAVLVTRLTDAALPFTFRISLFAPARATAPAALPSAEPESLSSFATTLVPSFWDTAPPLSVSTLKEDVTSVGSVADFANVMD